MVSLPAKRVEQAREEKANLLILQINSPGGSDTVTDSLADLVAGIKDMKTVAYIEDRAVGLAALVPLACRDIVFKKDSRMGDVRQVISGRTAGSTTSARARSPAWPARPSSGLGSEAIPRPSRGRWSIPTPRSSRPRTPRPAATRLILPRAISPPNRAATR